MKLIFAQGNPGNNYASSRHNTGWRFIDAFAAKHDLKFNSKSKFQADIAEYTTATEKVLLVKPTTFYNQTGQSLRAIIDFYKITARDCLIVYDDLALPIGTIRTRYGGSSAGNNGIKSINTHVGEDTARLRIGIFDPDTPGDTLDSVLGAFTTAQLDKLSSLESDVLNIFTDFIENHFDTTTIKLIAS